MREKRYTPSVSRALAEMGRNIQIARKKRRMTVADLAARMGVSVPTVRRLEQGDGGTSTGNLALALLALGELGRLAGLMDMGDDDTGLMMDASELPQRVHRRGAKRRKAASDEASDRADEDVDLGGTAF